MNTIAVAGVPSHIGTTTQAIQFTLALMALKKQACYIELNSTEYLKNLLKFHDEAEDKIVKINYREMTMYKKSFLKAIPIQDWDFLVCDFGEASGNDFNELLYSKGTIQIIICGSKPNEIFELQKLLENPIYNNAFYIFSFVPESEKVSIKSLMGTRADRTFFADTILNPYNLKAESEHLYAMILRCLK